MNPIDQLAVRAGGLTRLAESFDVSKQTLVNWRTRGTPPDRCVEIEQLTGFTVEQMRPDLRWIRVPDPAWPQGRPVWDKQVK
jgi:DNA-binding transcriptional regulator YdaS (Cro superfamily)